MKLRVQLNLSIQDAEVLKTLIQLYGPQHESVWNYRMLELRLDQLIKQQYEKKRKHEHTQMLCNGEQA